VAQISQSNTPRKMKYVSFEAQYHSKHLSEKGLERATRYHWRGWKKYRQRDYDASLFDWRKAVRIRHGLLGPAHAATQESQDLIGCVLQRKGLEDQVRRKYLKSLKKSIEYESKGDALKRLGKYDLALKAYQKSLDLEQATVGRDHPIVAALYRKMAVTLKGLGRTEKSSLVYCDALAG
jgi:tetratricopeptide (TPR) repeat protein